MLFILAVILVLLQLSHCRLSTVLEIETNSTCDFKYFIESPPIAGIWHAPPLYHKTPFLRNNTFSVWGTDHHRGPGAEFARIFSEIGVKYVDYGLKQKGLGVVPHMTHQEALGPLIWGKWEKFRRDFFEEHKNNEEMQRAHAVLCSMPVHFCLLLLPFNKPIIGPFAFRFEGPYLPNKDSSHRFFQVLQQFDRNLDVVMGGTNLYDTMYNNHFLGSRKQVWLPVVGHYVDQWDPTGWQHGKGGALTRYYHPDPEKVGWENRILVGPYRLAPSAYSVLFEIRKQSAELGYHQRFPHIRDIYPSHYEYSQLCDHDAVLLLPYSAHAYGIAEMRAMNVPILIPSKRLYAEWISRFHLMYERSSQPGVYKTDSNGNIVGEDFAWFYDPNGPQEYAWNPPSSRSLSKPHSPIVDSNVTDTEYWLQYADFYTWEQGVIYFDDIEELFFKIETTDFAEESRKIAEYNKKLHSFVTNQWESVFSYLFSDLDGSSPPPQVPETYEEGMRLWEEKTRSLPWDQLLAAGQASQYKQTFSGKNWLVIIVDSSVEIVPSSSPKSSSESSNLLIICYDCSKRQHLEFESYANDVLSCAFSNFDILHPSVREFGLFVCGYNRKENLQHRSILQLWGALYALSNGANKISFSFANSLEKQGIDLLIAAIEKADVELELPQNLPIANALAALGDEKESNLASRKDPFFPCAETCTTFDIPASERVDALAAPRADIQLLVQYPQKKQAPKHKKQCTIFAHVGTLVPAAGVTFALTISKSAAWALLSADSFEDTEHSIQILSVQRLLWEVGSGTSLTTAPVSLKSWNPFSSLKTESSFAGEHVKSEIARLAKYLHQWEKPVDSEGKGVAFPEISYQLAQDLVAAGFLRKKDTEITRRYLIALANLGVELPRT